jgi:hypothetical protein
VSLTSGSCVASCDKGFFANALTGQCQKCPTGCTSCSDLKTCLTCDIGFQMNTDGLKRCEPCSAHKSLTNCNACYANKCLKCAKVGTIQYRKSAGKCVQNCEKNQYYNSEANECMACKAGCAECTSESKCLTCTRGF